MDHKEFKLKKIKTEERKILIEQLFHKLKDISDKRSLLLIVKSYEEEING
jgi:hypothetical protein